MRIDVIFVFFQTEFACFRTLYTCSYKQNFDWIVRKLHRM